MLHKHRDKEKGGSSVWELLRVLIRDAGDSAKYCLYCAEACSTVLCRRAAGMGDLLGTELGGQCGAVQADLQAQHRLTRAAGQEVQENLLRSLFDFHNTTKLLQANKVLFEKAQKNQVNIT